MLQCWSIVTHIQREVRERIYNRFQEKNIRTRERDMRGVICGKKEQVFSLNSCNLTTLKCWQCNSQITDVSVIAKI